MSSLYEIDQRLQDLENFNVDNETGEIIDNEEDFNKLFDEIQMDLASKIENTMLFYKNLLSDADAIKQEEKKLELRRKAKENLAERLKARIDNYIKFQYTNKDGVLDSEKLNAHKFETPRLKLSYRKSDVVNITDESKLPKEFLKVETKVTPMKADIKKAIKGGKLVEGAVIDTNYNMQVK